MTDTTTLSPEEHRTLRQQARHTSTRRVFGWVLLVLALPGLLIGGLWVAGFTRVTTDNAPVKALAQNLTESIDAHVALTGQVPKSLHLIKGVDPQFQLTPAFTDGHLARYSATAPNQGFHIPVRYVVSGSNYEVCVRGVWDSGYLFTGAEPTLKEVGQNTCHVPG